VEARFSAPIQTGPGAYPASCTMGTRSFPGVKRPVCGVDPPPPPPPSSAEVKERVELYLYSSGPSWPVLGRTSPFTSTQVSIPLFQKPCTRVLMYYTKIIICT
jgi:hypothetical protein